jgi:hypothetical protein
MGITNSQRTPCDAVITSLSHFIEIIWIICEIWGSHGTKDNDIVLLGYDAV